LPADAATYQTLGFLGSTATSEMRPVVRLGPTLRNAKGAIASAVSRGSPFWASSAATAVTVPAVISTPRVESKRGMR
jgi:hypothetical protein